jgi:hypothetical protein
LNITGFSESETMVDTPFPRKKPYSL